MQERGRRAAGEELAYNLKHDHLPQHPWPINDIVE